MALQPEPDDTGFRDVAAAQTCESGRQSIPRPPRLSKRKSGKIRHVIRRRAGRGASSVPVNFAISLSVKSSAGMRLSSAHCGRPSEARFRHDDFGICRANGRGARSSNARVPRLADSPGGGEYLRAAVENAARRCAVRGRDAARVL
jgi:hypothetical protein